MPESEVKKYVVRLSADERETLDALTHRNKHHAKANWQFTNDAARVKLRHLYPSI